MDVEVERTAESLNKSDCTTVGRFKVRRTMTIDLQHESIAAEVTCEITEAR